MARGCRIFWLRWSLLILAVTVSRAEIRWEKTELEISPASTESLAPAEFHFINAGPDPVTLQDIRPDCDCVIPAPAAHTYRPGEAGSVSVVFRVQGQDGEHHVPIQVTALSSGKALHTVLILHVHVRDALQFSEKFVYWRANQPLEPRIVTVTLPSGGDLTIQKVVSDSPSFQTAIVPTADPEKFELMITPPTQHIRNVATILVTTFSAKDRTSAEHRLLARVW